MLRKQVERDYLKLDEWLMPVHVDLEGLHIINYSNGTLEYIRDDDI